MIQKWNFARPIQILQMFLILGLTIFPAYAASDSDIPSLPLILEGSVVNGDTAGTADADITVKLNGKVVGSTSLGSDGTYGTEPNTKLIISCEPEDYENLEFYVDGMESDVHIDDWKNVNPGDTLELDLTVAASPVKNKIDAAAHSSTVPEGTGSKDMTRSGSGLSVSTEMVNSGKENVYQSTTIEPIVSSNEDTGVHSESRSDTALAAGVGLMVLSVVSIVVFVKYKFEK